MKYDLFQAPSAEPKFAAIDDDDLRKTMNQYGMTAQDRHVLMDRGYVSFDGITLVLQEAKDASDTE